jgi:hypothetical protein
MCVACMGDAISGRQLHVHSYDLSLISCVIRCRICSALHQTANEMAPVPIK